MEDGVTRSDRRSLVPAVGEASWEIGRNMRDERAKLHNMPFDGRRYFTSYRNKRTD